MAFILVSDQLKYYANADELKRACRLMKNKLERVVGKKKANYLPVITMLDGYLTGERITPGDVKLVYHFNLVMSGEVAVYNRLKQEANNRGHAEGDN